MESFTSIPCVLMLRARHSEFEFLLSLFFSDWTTNTRGIPCGDRSGHPLCQLCISGGHSRCCYLIHFVGTIVVHSINAKVGTMVRFTPLWKVCSPWTWHVLSCPYLLFHQITKKKVKVVLSRSTLKDYSVEKPQELIAPHSVLIGTRTPSKPGVTVKCSICRNDNR